MPVRGYTCLAVLSMAAVAKRVIDGHSGGCTMISVNINKRASLGSFQQRSQTGALIIRLFIVPFTIEGGLIAIIFHSTSFGDDLCEWAAHHCVTDDWAYKRQQLGAFPR
jgi:hypothetical protein